MLQRIPLRFLQVLQDRLREYLALAALVLCGVTIPVIPAAAQAKAVTEAWVAQYNGGEGSIDSAVAVVLDTIGNSYVTGISGSDYATVKYDPNGNQLWLARYNGPANAIDAPTGIALNASGDVYVTGASFGLNGAADYVTIKYDANGREVWVARYSGATRGGGRAIAVDASGNVYVTGVSWAPTTGEDYATIKYDANGHELWVVRYNGFGNNPDAANALALDVGGNVYVTGESAGQGSAIDYVTIKYDANGNELWVGRYDGPGNSYDAAYAIALDNASNVYVTGRSEGLSNSGLGNDDYATVKYAPNGNKLWVARYDGPANSSDQASAIAVDNDNNVCVTGMSVAPGRNADYSTVKYDSNGNQLWVARYSGPDNVPSDTATAIATDVAGNVYVTGNSGGRFATLKYDRSGNELWVAIKADGAASALALDARTNVYVTGVGGSKADYVTIKYAQASDFTGLTQLIDTLFAQGNIARQMRNSLLARVKSAESSYNRSNACSAVNQLYALRNKIRALSGKKLRADSAERVLNYLNDLLSQLFSAPSARGSCQP